MRKFIDILKGWIQFIPPRDDLATPNARQATGRNDRPDSPSFDICDTSGALVYEPTFEVPPRRRFPDECFFRAMISKIESNVPARSLWCKRGLYLHIAFSRSKCNETYKARIYAYGVHSKSFSLITSYDFKKLDNFIIFMLVIH